VILASGHHPCISVAQSASGVRKKVVLPESDFGDDSPQSVISARVFYFLERKESSGEVDSHYLLEQHSI